LIFFAAGRTPATITINEMLLHIAYTLQAQTCLSVIYAEKLKRAFSRLDKRFIHHSIFFGAKLPISALVTPLPNRRR
jgi:hypothetical protein